MSAQQEPALVVARDLDRVWLARCHGGRVYELDVVPTDERSRWGAICLGRVIEPRPALGGAFVDGGVGDQIFATGFPGGRIPNRGSRVLVRIVRDDRRKGPRATARVTVPGLLLVLLAGKPERRVSRRLDAEAERGRLSRIAAALPGGDEHGWIVRAAASAASEEELLREAEQLLEVWRGIAAAAQADGPPRPLWTEPDPACRFVRERLGLAPERVVVDDEDAAVAERLRRLLALPGGRAAAEVVRHDGPGSAILDRGLERAADEALSARVRMPGGGGLVVERTEALAAIDVNAGTDLAEGADQSAALRVNRQAAAEAVRQITLRNLAGLIVIDFVELRGRNARAEVDDALGEALAGDVSRTRALPMSPLGVVELSRQYLGPALADRLGAACAACDGAGWREAVDGQARRLLRHVRQGLRTAPGRRIEARAPAPILAEARRLAGEARWDEPIRSGGSVRFVEASDCAVTIGAPE